MCNTSQNCVMWRGKEKGEWISDMVFLSFFFLNFNGKMNKVLALPAAAAFISFPAFPALNKQQVAGFIGAVHMSICRLTTLVAFGNDLFSDPLPQPVVENKILSVEFSWQLFLLYLIGIINNAAFEVLYLLVLSGRDKRSRSYHCTGQRRPERPQTKPEDPGD